MVDWKRYGLYALIGVGLVAPTVGADLVDSRRLALTLALGGSGLAWGSMLLFGKVRWGRYLNDERFSAICYRSGFVAMWVVTAALTTMLLSIDFVARPVPTRSVLMGMLAVALASYLGATAWYERRM